MNEPLRPPSESESGPGLSEWRSLWREDRREGLAPAPGWIGRLKYAFKRRLRRWVLGSQADLWERQRRYNLLVQKRLEAGVRLEASASAAAERLDRLESADARLGADLQQVQAELVRDLKHTRDTSAEELAQSHDSLMSYLQGHFEFLESHSARLDVLEGLRNQGFEDLRRHLDALYARLDQRIDGYRRRTDKLSHDLRSLLAAAERGPEPALARTVEERDYLALEEIFRGDERDIAGRIEPYLEFLEPRGPVLDLGCGRGEALEVLKRRGVKARGVDRSEEMVAACRDKGLNVDRGELFETLAALPEGELGGIVSFHVIEHLPPESLNRLARLAWRALRPDGVLVLETPNPLSLVVAARNFWIDPTHRRPVHPAALQLTFELAGFDPVQRIDLQPFAAADRMPDLDAETAPAELGELARELRGLRDHLDRLLYGFQDYGMVGFKAA